MRVKGIETEDFVNYKLPSMFIATCFCDFKCEKESGVCCCQNSNLAKEEIKEINDDSIILNYLSNKITRAIVIGGLEPFKQFEEIKKFIYRLRYKYDCDDTVVIYTGYYPDEISEEISILKGCKNIVIKFGRFVPDLSERYDPILGIKLASYNQYAKEIS